MEFFLNVSSPGNEGRLGKDKGGKELDMVKLGVVGVVVGVELSLPSTPSCCFRLL